MSALVRSLTPARADEGNDMSLDTTGIGDDGCRLLRAAALAEDEACFQVLEVEGAELPDSDGLVVELALLSWVVATGDPSELDLRRQRRADRSQAARHPR